ncbi:alpha/beta fold hydrolase [Umezawaea tangerina]|uniref:Pimeloyl-ACP methyl ester carboxylesterase n=1 Tax=Umezawaea tangerina TaxID=84725 RepID=A0A2T0SLN2_9PSEU|nr:alpha/beta hydrolase [Umezawaea tangerina]PRY34314.1 pimeloyl-ACP methyl ester carboxylesterase [Umezawaea tangerina]
MPTLTAHDGTELAYQETGEGGPLVCLAGGPMLDSAYLGDLGGLPRSLRLIRPDLRGTGASAVPADPATYRCDRLVDDVEALREHLGLDRIDLLGHSAGANIAVLYATRHPERVSRLVLVTPSTFAVGLTATAEQRREVVEARKGEPEYDRVSAALARIAAGEALADDWDAIVPFTYGRWDAAARAHHEAGRRHPEAAAVFGSEGAYDPDATRGALSGFDAPVLLLAGELDLAAPVPVVAEYAGLFPKAQFVTQPGAGHFPWLDDPASFTTTTAAFLS